MSTNLYFASTIDVIVNASDADLRKIAIALAKENPETFVRLAGEQIGITFHGYFIPVALREKVMPIASVNLVEAIREVRGVTGMSLKDAKEYVESLRSIQS